jgi:putative transposase
MYIRQNYRIYPTKLQQLTLNQWLGQGRFVWNYMLSLNIATYDRDKKFVFGYDMNNLLPELKKQPDTCWLSEIPSQCLQQKCQDLDTALKQSFKKNQNKKGFPKFKSRKFDESGIRFPNFKFEGNRIVLPKMKGGIKIKLHRPLLGKKEAITVSKDKIGRFFVSILVKIDDQIKYVEEINNAIGIDLGLKSFAVTSDAEIIENPKFHRKAEKKLVKIQRSHSRKQKGSSNREKARVKLVKTHKIITNQRKDFCNQVASSIAKNNDLIAIEDLNVKGMMKNHNLAKSVADVSWGQFISALKWQAHKRGKYLVEINRWYPSSKTCFCCGGHKADLTLTDRVYVCPDCGFEIDRDLNAAINILQEGIRQHNTVGTTEINACGVISSC